MALFTVFHATMPYCIKKQENGKWIFLNREYKPIGFFTNKHIQYENHPVEAEIPGLTEKVASKLSYSGESDGEEIYLYNDGCVPTHTKQDMDDYLGRIALLGKLKIDHNRL